MATRSRWTDERLDDAFAQLRSELRELRQEMRDEFRELRREVLESRRWLIGLFASVLLFMVAILVELGVQG
jgi:hypothetical protein